MPAAKKTKKMKNTKSPNAPVMMGGGVGQQIQEADFRRPAKPKASEEMRQVHTNAVAKLTNPSNTAAWKADDAISWLNVVFTLENRYDFSEETA